STLLNRILGTKVSIVSDKPQTTRTQVRGVLTKPEVQVVFVDTPGIHKPRTLLGERLNETATEALGGVDVVVFVIDATQPVGRGATCGGGAWSASARGVQAGAAAAEGRRRGGGRCGWITSRGLSRTWRSSSGGGSGTGSGWGGATTGSYREG